MGIKYGWVFVVGLYVVLMFALGYWLGVWG